MSLKSTIVTDLTDAMKAGEAEKRDTLRMLKAEIMKEETTGEKRELADGEIVKVVKRMIKQRHEAAEHFRAGDRAEQAAAESAEIKLLEVYLPAQMSAEDLQKIVAEKKAELGITDKSKMGVLMGAVMKEVGDSADGNAVKQVVAAALE